MPPLLSQLHEMWTTLRELRNARYPQSANKLSHWTKQELAKPLYVMHTRRNKGLLAAGEPRGTPTTPVVRSIR